MDGNDHVREYLAFYAAMERPPGFAVLLNGPWGIGKTFLLRRFLGEVATDDLKPVYVSLNGLASAEEIDKALFRAMHSVLGHKLVGAAAGLAKGALKGLKGLSIDVDILDLVNRYTADLYVFDDLERCGLPIEKALAYVNAFVEHGNRKVVIACNEAEIGDREAYLRIREKVVGMTLEVRPEFETAIAAFLGSMADPRARGFLAGKVDAIRALHGEAGLENLRVLQRAMWDFERLYAAFHDRHRAHDEAMTAALRMVLALAFETKSGRMGGGDLQDRRSSHVTALVRGTGAVPTAIGAAVDRYPMADVTANLLSDDALVALLVEGRVDTAAIRRDLDASPYFASAAGEAEWQTVWHGIERADDDVAAAIARMEASFAERAYTVPGEILHVFGLRLNLARIGAIAASIRDVVAECRSYVDDVLASGRLPPIQAGEDPSELRATGYGGLAIVSSETEEYRELHAHLVAGRVAMAEARYPLLAQELLVMLTEAPEAFAERIAQGSGATGDVADMPVLAEIDEGAFVSALLAVHPASLRKVMRALGARYRHGSLVGDLAGERPWAEAMARRLAAETARLPPFARYRMQLFVTQSVEAVPELRASPSAATYES